MTLMTSETRLSVGIRAVDADHEILEDLLVSLEEAAENGASQDRMGVLLRELEKRTLSHFAMEEGMMAAMRYPGLARHRLNHQLALEQVQAIIARFGQQGAAQHRDWVSLLSELYAVHVERDDMHFGRWVKALDRR